MKIKDFWDSSNPNKKLKAIGLIVELSKLINEDIKLFLPYEAKEIASRNTLFLPDPEYTKKLALLKKMNPNRSAELMYSKIRLAHKTEVFKLDFEFSHSLSTPTVSLSGKLSFHVIRHYNYENTSNAFISTKTKMTRNIDVVLNVFDHQILEEMYLDYMTY
tara:strand:- start:7 stop:489 length:483 start_codon:yes stop_codon:yes gene_type:complete